VVKPSAVIFVLPNDIVEMDGISVVTNTRLEMCGLGSRCSGGQTDSDHESVVSDYSEMADPVKEHLANIHLLQEAELRFGSVLGLPPHQSYAMRPWLAVDRRPDEDEVEFLQRRRKINFLSLAQEFAAVKKVYPDALPFIVQRQRNDDSSREEDDESGDVSLAQEFAAVSCADNTDSEVCQVGATEFHSTVNDEHSQSSNVVTDSCSSIPCAAEASCNSESGVMVSIIPDVVQGLHSAALCDSSRQPDTNCAEVDLVDDCHSSDLPIGTHAYFKTSSELADTVISHSKNVDLVSHTSCC